MLGMLSTEEGGQRLGPSLATAPAVSQLTPFLHQHAATFWHEIRCAAIHHVLPGRALDTAR